MIMDPHVRLIATFNTITDIILMNARLVHSMTNTSTTFVNALINETRSIILGLGLNLVVSRT